MKKRKILALTSVTMTLVLVMAVTFTACEGSDDDNGSSAGSSLLGGRWCFNSSGTSTIINMTWPAAYGTFVSFAQNQWKDVADAGLVSVGDQYLRDIKLKSGNSYTCSCLMYHNDGGSYDRVYWQSGVSLTLASDGNSFKVQYGNAYATLYRVSSNGSGGNNGNGDNGGGNNGNANSTGSISFWIAKDFGGGNITVSLAGKGSGTLRNYFTSGRPDCGDAGTVTFSGLSYGTYSFTAKCSKYSWSGNITVDRSCTLMQLQ